jgi:hypothetical protein
LLTRATAGEATPAKICRMTEATTNDRSTVPACPWWCTETALDHRTDYDSRLDDIGSVLQRVHGVNVGAVSVIQTEVNRHGAVTLEDDVAIMLEQESGGSTLARQLARDLEAAADLVDRISAGTR